MYAEVVVLTYQAPDINSFTYEVPKELEKEIKIGQLVEVPFGIRNPMGVIINISRVRPSTGSDPEPTKRKLTGDVNFAKVEPLVAAITPVPGGIGPMTVASLFENLLEAYKKQAT